MVLYFVVGYTDSRELTYYINKNYLLIEYGEIKSIGPMDLPSSILIDFQNSLEHRVTHKGELETRVFNIDDLVEIEIVKLPPKKVETYMEGSDFISISELRYDFHDDDLNSIDSGYWVKNRFRKIDKLNEFVPNPKYLKLLSLIYDKNAIHQDLILMESSSIINGEKKRIYVKEWGITKIPLEKHHQLLELVGSKP